MTSCVVHNKVPSHFWLICLPQKCMCLLKISSYSKGFISDYTLITPKCSLKICQKTPLQLIFKSLSLLLPAMLISLFLWTIAWKNPLMLLHLHLYSSFLNSSTWSGRTYHDSSHAPFKGTLMEDKRDLWKICIHFKKSAVGTCQIATIYPGHSAH